MPLDPLEIVYVLASIGLVVSGLMMVGLAVRAYFRTQERAMAFLSAGFALIVAAAVATTFTAFITNFENGLFLLTINYIVTTIGYVFLIYSVTVVTR